MPETAKRTARVPILGANGRISDDYVPAAIGEGVESAEAAATRAETAATDAEGSATKAQESATAAGNAKAAADTAQKGAESAKTAAEDAKAAAEKAKTAAETAQSAAAGSAQDAQQSATAAAQSAESVADKFISSAQATTLEPGSQATASVADQVLTIGVPKGEKGDQGDPGEDGHTPQRGVDYWTAEDVEAIVEDAKTQAVAELAEIGNVPKRTVTDLVAHGEDAYAQKPIEVRVKGKTWVNRWPQFPTTTTTNGITLTCDETGLFKLTGTATARTTFRQAVSGLAANKTVGAIASNSISNAAIDLYAYADGSFASAIIQKIGNAFKSAAIPASGWDTIYAYIIVESGQTVNASFRVMLVDGTEAPDCFTHPASIASVETEKLVTSGKNLLPEFTLSNASSMGMTATLNDDNSITLNGAATGRASFSLSGSDPFADVIGKFVPETYTLSVGTATAGIKFDVMDWRKQTSIFSVSTKNATSFTKTLSVMTEYTYVRIQVDEGTTLNNVTIYPQLELGSTATAYEPPNITETPLPEVELRSLPNGTCDELVIKADGTCEVERRTQLVDGEVVALGTPTTEPQSPVTLPTLPAPTFNAYSDADIPSDTSVEYARDINIVLSNLEAVQTAFLGGEE